MIWWHWFLKLCLLRVMTNFHISHGLITKQWFSTANCEPYRNTFFFSGSPLVGHWNHLKSFTKYSYLDLTLRFCLNCSVLILGLLKRTMSRLRIISFYSIWKQAISIWRRLCLYYAWNIETSKLTSDLIAKLVLFISLFTFE